MKIKQHSHAVTVIALCYNHAKFLIECLESIQKQTFQDFDLIITDDCSTDDSPALIEVWIKKNRPTAQFIRHRANVGLCKTLNEAIDQAQGEFISMIATDDIWEPQKIERQFLVMQSQPLSVAVVYSDAIQMDESGATLPKSFLEAHFQLEGIPPTGKIFPALAHRNFIPAMATLIRREAIKAVGGYDERLSYEDYDMWLRLSEKFDFTFLPETLARYRIVSTSIIRTIFSKPTPNHCYTLFLIHEKWIASKLLSLARRDEWKEKMWGAAYMLYAHGDRRAKSCLWKAFYLNRRPRTFLMAITCSLGLSRLRVKKLLSLLLVSTNHD